MKHCNITDVTQLAKQSDPMQTYLFGESKASELNFVGDLAEKISKSASPKRTRTPTKPSLHTNRPERIHWNRRLALPSPGTFLPMSTSLFGRLPSGENGNRQPIQLQEFREENFNANSPQQTNSGSEVSTVDMIFHFHAPPRERHPQKVAGRLQFVAQNWQIITQDPWVLQTIQGYKIELLSHPW